MESWEVLALWGHPGPDHWGKIRCKTEVKYILQEKNSNNTGVPPFPE